MLETLELHYLPLVSNLLSKAWKLIISLLFQILVENCHYNYNIQNFVFKFLSLNIFQVNYRNLQFQGTCKKRDTYLRLLLNKNTNVESHCPSGRRQRTTFSGKSLTMCLVFYLLQLEFPAPQRFLLLNFQVASSKSKCFVLGASVHSL